MPGMEVLDLAIAARSLLPFTRTLLFTRQAGTSNILLQADRDGYDFQAIQKPIHPEKLIEILNGN